MIPVSGRYDSSIRKIIIKKIIIDYHILLKDRKISIYEFTCSYRQVMINEDYCTIMSGNIICHPYINPHSSSIDFDEIN